MPLIVSCSGRVRAGVIPFFQTSLVMLTSHTEAPETPCLEERWCRPAEFPAGAGASCPQIELFVDPVG